MSVTVIRYRTLLSFAINKRIVLHEADLIRKIRKRTVDRERIVEFKTPRFEIIFFF